MAPASPFSKPSKDDMFEYELPEGSGDTIPDDKYEVKCVGLVDAPSQAGNPMWTFNFVVTKGQYAGFDAPVFCALTEAALWKLEETLKALGLMDEDGRKVSFSKRDALGRLAIATFEENTYKKRTRSQIAALEPHPKGAGYKPKGVTGNPFTDPDPEEEVAEEEGVGEEEAATDEVQYEDPEEGTDEVTEEDQVEEEEPPPPPVRKKVASAPASRPAVRPAPPAAPTPRKTVGAPAKPTRR